MFTVRWLQGNILSKKSTFTHRGDKFSLHTYLDAGKHTERDAAVPHSSFRIFDFNSREKQPDEGHTDSGAEVWNKLLHLEKKKTMKRESEEEVENVNRPHDMNESTADQEQSHEQKKRSPAARLREGTFHLKTWARSHP